MTGTCGDCGETVESALLRHIQLTVDDAEVDAQHLCPRCFADWIDRYQREMQADPEGLDDGNIIVD